DRPRSADRRARDDGLPLPPRGVSALGVAPWHDLPRSAPARRWRPDRAAPALANHARGARCVTFPAVRRPSGAAAGARPTGHTRPAPEVTPSPPGLGVAPTAGDAPAPALSRS